MRRIAITLDDVKVTARLLDDAPVTAQRLWDVLPFADQFEHSIWSGLMLHSTNHPKLDLDTSRYPLIEKPVTYIASGDVVVWPQDGSVSIAYGPTQFRWLAKEWVVTKVGEIEGDITPFARAAYRMMFEGARRVTIARDETARAPREASVRAGAKLVEIELDGMTWVAELLEDDAPEYCQALWDALPLEGPTSITHSSGEVLHCWTTMPGPKSTPRPGRQTIIPVAIRGKEVGGTYVAFDPKSLLGQHPGDLVWGSNWNDLRIIYGQGRFGGHGLKFGHIVRGDLGAFADRARSVRREGSKVIKLRKFND
jgi:hypothetical protein